MWPLHKVNLLSSQAPSSAMSEGELFAEKEELLCGLCSTLLRMQATKHSVCIKFAPAAMLAKAALTVWQIKHRHGKQAYLQDFQHLRNSQLGVGSTDLGQHHGVLRQPDQTLWDFIVHQKFHVTMPGPALLPLTAA